MSAGRFAAVARGGGRQGRKGGAPPWQRAPSSNRFIRFGYRRPPPWSHSFNNLQESQAEEEFSSSRAFREDVTPWPLLNDQHVELSPVTVKQDASVPSLAHGIDVVLRGDGLYPIDAPWAQTTANRNRFHQSRSNGSNDGGSSRSFYSDSLRHIVPPERIAWDRMPAYIPASKDGVLHDIAESTRGVRYCSSTSSIIPALSAFYHLLSNYRDTDLVGGLSPHIRDLPVNFARMHRKPTAFMLSRIAPGAEVYSINNHTGPDRGPSILRELGHSMERMLTMPPQEFTQKFVTDISNVGSAEPSSASSTTDEVGPCGDPEDRQFYHYSRASKFLLRAQIDCRDERTGEVFDVKTRAVAPIRYDLDNYSMFTDHRLRFLHGKYDSYEREFYDMVRSVFLKYALQLRIGRMSGALVAYHNTSEVLGLEYIRLSEMESYVFGGAQWGDAAFSASVRLFEKVLGYVTEKMQLADGERAKVVLHTEWSQLKMYVFVQRVRDAEADPFGQEEFLKRELADDSEKWQSTATAATRSSTRSGCDSGEIGDGGSRNSASNESSNSSSGSSVSSVRKTGLSDGGDDSDGADTGLLSPVGSSGRGERRQRQWHLDSFVHGNTQGFSMVGGHAAIGALGGTEVEEEGGASRGVVGAAERRKQRGRGSAAAMDKSSFDVSPLEDAEQFRVWELNVAPLVNGSLALRSKISLGRDDRFSLKFDLREVDEVRNEHVTKFVTGLGVIYLR